MNDVTATGLLEASIERVWNEHDGDRRLAALAEVYHPEARIYEPERSITGHAAISDTVAGVLADMPPDFRFAVTGPTLGSPLTLAVRDPGAYVPAGARGISSVERYCQPPHRLAAIGNPSSDAISPLCRSAPPP